MVETLNLFRQLYKRWKHRKAPPREVSEVFRFKYTCFRDLLDSNAQLLTVITDMEEKLQGRQVFGMAYVRSQATRAAFHAFRMIKNLDVLSGHKYPVLYRVLNAINEKIKGELGPKKEAEVTEFILPYERITKDMVDWAGGKSANLGEVKNRAGLPIPPGFAITTKAFQAFLRHNDLVDDINKRKMEIDPQDPESIDLASRDIQRLILAAALPPELEAALFRAHDALAAEVRSSGASGPLRVSLRSSAIGEDSDLSFAGQYLTRLNVTEAQLDQAYKEIVASLYASRAIAYRLHQGIRDEDAAMSVACLAMVDAVASGVMYTRHPFNPLENHIVITAVWGLGPYAVDGAITPDRYVVAKGPVSAAIATHIAVKPVELAADPAGGTKEIPVPPEDQEKPCLTPEQVQVLAGYGVKLEEHYQCPQDIEWALDRQARLLVLQTRPLHPARHAKETRRTPPRVEGFEVLLEGGDVAFPGVGGGPAFHITTDEDLLHFPDGAVLVAKHSSPKFVLVMAKAQAIVTDSGSAAGHMAAVAREFGVPSLLDAKTATRAIPHGEEITVDAYAGRVYRGRVPQLLALVEDRTPHMQDTPVYQTLKKVADHIVPLRLVDPRAKEFAPEHCRSLHDLGRLVHEYSYNEMFKISDIAADRGEGALKLDAPIPLDLYLIDIGGGLTGVAQGDTRIKPENLASVPFQALMKGMTFEGLQGMEPRPVQFSGLFAVMREQMLATPQLEERFGEKSYAIISDKYLNFSSRVGYHYSVLDAYAGATVNKNYLTFSFKGGAADDLRRNRRVRAIAIVLLGLDFAVDVKGDRVDARLQKYPAHVILERLEAIGRLLIFTRQMDMLMAAEASVEAVAQNFLAGNYRLEPEVFQN